MVRVLIKSVILSLVLATATMLTFPPAHAELDSARSVLLSNVAETEAVIDEVGDPDLFMSRTEEDDEIWFYEDPPVDELDGDFIMVVDEDTGVMWKIYEAEEPKNNPKKQGWIDQQVEQVEALIDSAKDRRDRIDRRISEFSGLNRYFDRAEFLTSDITLGLGKHPGDAKTDFVYNPQDERLSVSFKMSFR